MRLVRLEEWRQPAVGWPAARDDAGSLGEGRDTEGATESYTARLSSDSSGRCLSGGVQLFG